MRNHFFSKFQLDSELILGSEPKNAKYLFHMVGKSQYLLNFEAYELKGKQTMPKISQEGFVLDRNQL